MRRRHLTATFVVLPVLIAGCGSSDAPQAIVAPPRTAEHAQPPVSGVASTLGRLADVPEAGRRLAYLAPERAAAITTPVSSADVARLVLGAQGAARVGAASPRPARAVQVGRSITVLDGPDETRRVLGAPAAREQLLRSTTPPNAVLAPETLSAVQSCLGDPAAEVILGPRTLGPTSAIGVSLTDDADAPAGPKLRICAAPHYVRELHATEERLERAFGGRGSAAVIGEDEIGEREIVSAVVPIGQLDATELRGLLAGGPALLRLAGR